MASRMKALKSATASPSTASLTARMASAGMRLAVATWSTADPSISMRSGVRMAPPITAASSGSTSARKRALPGVSRKAEPVAM